MTTYILINENLLFLLVPYAIIGWLFVCLLGIGLLLNGIQSAIALDQWLDTCLITGHMADETISAWAHRNHHKRTERLINWLFRDPLHCAKAYLSEMEGTQNAPEYQNGKGA